jgi:hypothetical protein
VTLFVVEDRSDVKLEQMRRTLLGVVINPDGLAGLDDHLQDSGIAVANQAGNQRPKNGRITPGEARVSQVEPPRLFGVIDDRIEPVKADDFGEVHLQIPCVGVIDREINIDRLGLNSKAHNTLLRKCLIERVVRCVKVDKITAHMT